MCGIIGYVGQRECTPILVEGLRRLEYRGYDSCGIALLSGERLVVTKARGRLDNLVAKLGDERGSLGIGHTRWATHGEPSEVNSHPHFSDSGRFAVVHNGIIENYQELKKFLIERSFCFVSRTDSEVVAHLIEYYYSGDMLSAIAKTCNRIRGSYALAIISLYQSETLYAVKKDSPLVIGLGKEEKYVASDMPALLDLTREFIIPEEGEIAVITQKTVEIYNKNRELQHKDIFFADWESMSAQKEGYPHFMLKEIFQQPEAINRTLAETFPSQGIKSFLPSSLIANLQRIQIIACGSAFFAGLAAKYFFEEHCRIGVDATVASEFRYSNPLIDKNTLAIIISQSGETADTLVGMRLAKKRGAFTLAIVNVMGSSIAREADYTLYTKAGTEIAVATTKGYTTQLVTLFKLAIELACNAKTCIEEACVDCTEGTCNARKEELRNKTGERREVKEELGEKSEEGRVKREELGEDGEICEELYCIGERVGEILADVSRFKALAYKYYSYNDCFFLGRNIDYALAMEGALKYKEISYIHAECYAAGELKHGTISLIRKGSLVVACSTKEELVEKTISNIKEVRTRGAKAIVITCFEKAFEGEAEHIIAIPKGKLSAPICAIVAFQLISYYVASNRSCDIDHPRNLAKSVTVE